MLIPLLRRLLESHLLDLSFELPDEPLKSVAGDLHQRIQEAIQGYELDLLFVHRDAESAGWERRREEIRANSGEFRVVAVVPVKMSEAWLLLNEKAIRDAVNPASSADLQLPSFSKVETCMAKDVLLRALTHAAELSTQRRRRFRAEGYRLRVAELNSDLSKLRKLASFQELEQELVASIQDIRLRLALNIPTWPHP
jgi:hypothetical protein